MSKGTKNLLILASILSVGILLGNLIPQKLILFTVFIITLACGLVVHNEEEDKMEKQI